MPAATTAVANHRFIFIIITFRSVTVFWSQSYRAAPQRHCVLRERRRQASCQVKNSCKSAFFCAVLAQDAIARRAVLARELGKRCQDLRGRWRGDNALSGMARTPTRQ